MSIKLNKHQNQPNVVKKSKASSEAVVKDNFIKRFVAYVTNSRIELGKVSWPTWKEVKVLGIAVAVLVLFMSLYLGLADFIFGWFVNLILSIGS